MPDNLTDPSRSTEQFRAFVRQSPGDPAKKAASKNRIILIAGIVIAVVVIVAIVAAVA
jgi:hypothetical protein